MAVEFGKDRGAMTSSPWLTGQLLVAMPSMPDQRFSHSVVYICSHSPAGAMGLVVNRLFGEANFRSLLDQLSIQHTVTTPDLPVHYGGPVEMGRGFVLHSPDYWREGTTKISDLASVSATVEILEAIAAGHGPEQVMMALGYSGWGAGQLEEEMKSNGWLIAPADEDLLFGLDLEAKWKKALAKIGISPALLSDEFGHA